MNLIYELLSLAFIFILLPFIGIGIAIASIVALFLISILTLYQVTIVLKSIFFLKKKKENKVSF